MKSINTNVIYIGDCLKTLRKLPANSVQCCVTSPPYYALRDYQVDGQIGLEDTPQKFIRRLVTVFKQVHRVLRHDGTLWVNIGDSYIGSKANTQYAALKQKELIGIPWMFAFAMRKAGWYLRQDIIWHKPNPMPESVTDRCTKAHEYIFLFTKSKRYYYDAIAIQEDGVIPAGTLAAKGSEERAAQAGVNARPAEYKEYTGKRNKRDVWTITTQPFAEAHFATFPPELCIKAGSSEKGCCSACGAPYVRLVDKELIPGPKACKDNTVNDRSKNADAMDQGSNRAMDGHKKGWLYQSETTGWKPGCNCNAEVKPCLVLDPFMGAGTTAVVAAKLGRQYIGCELNADYAGIAHKRLADELGMFYNGKILNKV